MNKWYKCRRYSHFDLPVSESMALYYVTLPNNVKCNPFLPFIKSFVTQYKFKNSAIPKVKFREIMYASHKDSNIFAYYSFLLSNKYEIILDNLNISENIIAYRKINGKCNIDFAHDAFVEIEKRKPCIVVTLDIENFFGSLKHDYLKKQLCKILNMTSLPDDYYTVFKHVTNYRYVNKSEILKELNFGKRRKRFPENKICDIEKFKYIIENKLINVYRNNNSFGIPQGLPISSTFSNIYMLEFDTYINNICKIYNIYYRRYSDDLIFVCPIENKELIINEVKNKLQLLGLSINEDKTKLSQVDSAKNYNVEYLGFTYCRNNMFIRSNTVSKFIYKMHKFVSWSKNAALKSKREGKNYNIKRTKLYSLFSHLGQLKKHKSSFKRTNFIKYAYKSSERMNVNSPRKQVSKYWYQLNCSIKAAQKEVNLA